jgi:hypothetical protein
MITPAGASSGNNNNNNTTHLAGSSGGWEGIQVSLFFPQKNNKAKP